MSIFVTYMYDLIGVSLFSDIGFGLVPHRDDKDIDKCKNCVKFRPKTGCFTKYINVYIEKNNNENKLNYLISGAEIMEEKIKKKRGRKPKNRTE